MLKCCHMNYFVFPKAGENLEDAPNSIFGGISGGLLQHDHLCTLPCTHPPFPAGFSTVLWGGVVVGNWPGAQFCGNRRGLRGKGGTRGADTLWQREQVAVRAAPWLLQVAITALLSLRIAPLHDAGAVPAQPRASVPFRRLFGGQQHLSQAPAGGLSPASGSGRWRAGEGLRRGAARTEGIGGSVLLNACPQATFLSSPPCHPSPSPFT